MCFPFTAEMRFGASCNIVQGVDMAIKEEERQEFAGTNVDNGPNSTDVNSRTGMTNDQFDMYQRKDIDTQVEFKDDLYDAMKRGDIQRVKELTGWTRDANRPDDTVITEVTKETQDNADKKEKDDEAKRQQALNEQNAAATGATGTEGPVDPLMAFMMDPFGLRNMGGTQPAASTYSGDSLEEAVRRGDWSAAARIMNALRAREQNEKQDFTGDGVVSGGNNNSGADGYSGYSSPSDYGWDPQWTNSNGDFQPWAEQPDGSVKTINDITFDAKTGQIKLQDGSTYTDPNGQPLAPQDGKDATVTASILAANTAGVVDLKTGETADGKPAVVKPATADDVTNARSANQDAKDQGKPVVEMTQAEVTEMNRFHGQFAAKLNALPAAERTKAWNAINGTDETARADAYRAVYGKDAQGRYIYDEHRKAMDALKFGGEMSVDRQTSVESQIASKYAPKPSGTVVAGTDDPPPPVEGEAPKTGTSTTTSPAAPSYAWAEDEWYYSGAEGQDGYGYMDDGYYYESDGGTWDEYGYTDKDGGYTWDNTTENGSLAGAYQDKNGNFVDKDGNLFLDGNYSDKPDAVAANAPAGGWASALKTAAADGTTFTMPAQNTTQPDVTQTVAKEDVDPNALKSTSTVTPPAATSLTGTASADNLDVAAKTNTSPTTTNTGAGSLYTDAGLANTVANFSQFMGSLTSFLSASEVTRALNEVAPSSFIDLSAPIPTGTASVWGTKFFDPAAINVNNTTPTPVDPLAAVPPTNPYYRPPSGSSMSA